jgi:TatD DNase family protein
MTNLHTHQSTNQKYTEIVNVYPWEYHENDKYMSIGIHPWYIDEQRLAEDLKTIENQMSNPKFMAIGECGLDKRIEIPFTLQEEIFKQQLQLAQQYKKPVIIHCVNTYQEVMVLKKSLKITIPLIIHGFSKGLTLANDLIANGFYLSFGKYLLLNDDLGQVLKLLPLDKCFLETDNSQFSLDEIYDKASEILNIDKNNLIERQKNNFEKVFLQK